MSSSTEFPGVLGLAPEEVEWLAPLCVVVRALDRTVWAKLLRTTRVQWKGSPVTTNELRKQAQRWCELGVLTMDAQDDYSLTSVSRHYLLRHLQVSRALHVHLRLWRAAVNPYGYNSHGDDADLHLSDAWVHLYSDSIVRFEESLACHDRVPYYSDLQVGLRARTGLFGASPPAIVELFGSEPAVEALQLLPNQLLNEYWSAYSELALVALLPLGEACWHWAVQAELSPDTRARLLTCAALQGDAQRVAALLPAVDETRTLSLAARAVVEITGGKGDTARSWALQACASVGKKRNEQRAWLLSPLCPWMALVLCTSSEMTDVSAGESILQAAESQKKRLPDGMVYEFLREFRRSVDSGQTDSLALQAIFDSAGGQPRASWLTLLTLILCEGWLMVSDKLGYESSVDLESVSWFADRDGYRWVAGQLLCAESGRVEETFPGEPKARFLKGFVPLSKLYQKRPAWESTLGTLERLLTSETAQVDSSAGGQAEQQLLWVLTPGTTPALEARLQLRNKRGFSRGKQLSCGKLAQIRDSAEGFLDDADREVLRHLQRYRERGIERYYLGGGALLALCGHPRVELAATPGERVLVHARPPRLLVQRQNNGSEPPTLRVVLSPKQCANGDPIVEETTDGSVSVVQLDPSLGDVAKALAKGLSVPPAGERRLTDLIGILSRKFDIHSDVAGTGLQQTPADERIHVRLWRGSSGVRARLGVQPIAEVERWFPPGEGQGTIVYESQGKSYQARRDLEQECLRSQQVLESCPALTLADRHGEDYVVRDLAGSLDLLVSLQALQPEVVIHWPEGAPLKVSAEKSAQDIEVKVGTSGGFLTLEGAVQISPDLKLQMSEVLARVGQVTGRFIPLGGDQFLALEESLLRRLSQLERVQLRQTTGKKGVEVTRVSAALGSVIESLVVDSSQAKVGKKAREALQRVSEAANLEVAPLPELKAELRAYQQQGVQWLCRLAHSGAGACLADDMGLGKTLQVLALLLHRSSLGPALVVAPTSVCSVWLTEAARFAPSLRVKRLTSAGRKESLADLVPGDVLVCSYGVMQNQIDSLKMVLFATVALDEAQAIKNVRAQRTRAALQLQGQFRVATTGTPIENHLGELWSLQNFLNPGLLGTQQQFEKRFSGPIENNQDSTSAELLRSLIEPFLLRRTKAAVLQELPPKTEVVLSVELSEEERAFYEEIRQKALRQLDSSGSGPQQRLRVLAELTRLRRAVCHPDMVVKRSGLMSSKLVAIQAQIRQLIAGGHRALVFSQFVDHLNCVRTWLNEEKIEYQYLVGATPERRRATAVEDFQAGKGALFLISLKAGGFGLNLTEADYVLILDPWWNPAAEDQAADRAHRMGQRKPVTVYRLVVRDTIEERILELHKKKRNLADRLLSGMSNASALDLEAMRGLLEQTALGGA